MLKDKIKKGSSKSSLAIIPRMLLNVHDFEFTGALICVVDEVPIHFNDRLFAVVGDSCRGVIPPVLFPPTGQWIFNLTIYSNMQDDANLSLKYWSYKKQVWVVFGTFPFTIDMICGNPMKPVILSLKHKGI
jgi:hypothetical protein